MSRSRNKRMANELDMVVESVRRDISRITGRELTHTDAQRIMAKTNLQPIVIVTNKSRKRTSISDMFDVK